MYGYSRIDYNIESLNLMIYKSDLKQLDRKIESAGLIAEKFWFVSCNIAPTRTAAAGV